MEQSLIISLIPAPTKPIVNPTSANSSACFFSWTEPDIYENISYYRVEIEYINVTYVIVDEECAPHNPKKKLSKNETVVNSTSYSFSGAQPATFYSIRVRAFNSKEFSDYSDIKYCQTSEGKTFMIIFAAELTFLLDFF